MLPGWSIFRPWPTSRGKTKCFIWAADLIMGSMAFCISGGKQYRQQRAAFWAGLCICRQHCAVNGINVRKIIRCLLLPQFAVRQYGSPSYKETNNQAHQYLCVVMFRLPPTSGVWHRLHIFQKRSGPESFFSTRKDLPPLSTVLLPVPGLSWILPFPFQNTADKYFSVSADL